MRKRRAVVCVYQRGQAPCVAKVASNSLESACAAALSAMPIKTTINLHVADSKMTAQMSSFGWVTQRRAKMTFAQRIA